MNASPAERFRWDLTRRWGAWARAGDLAAIQTDAEAMATRLNAGHLQTTLTTAARHGQITVLVWLLDYRQRFPEHQRSDHDWVCAAARAKQWALLHLALARGLSRSALSIAVTALLRHGQADAVVPHLAQLSWFQDGGTLLALALRSRSTAIREAALAGVADHLAMSAAPWMWSRGLCLVLGRLLGQGCATQAHTLLRTVGTRPGSEAVWAKADQWLLTRSPRVQQRWCTAWPDQLPRARAQLRLSQLARHRAPALARPRHRA